tara:strand:+ start:3364 stop:3987 length:624 start_codon:yes stop_codon:yes gene_type:complete
MEEIEQQIQQKGIERIKAEITEVQEDKPQPKPKKERTQAQKEAFEKARKKRAENLAKKKLEEEAMTEVQDTEAVDYYGEEGDEEVEAPLPVKQPEKPPPKKRGRPRKKKQEPPAPHFVQPPSQYPQHLYPVQGQFPMMMNPYSFQQPQPQPVVHNYYYGTNPKEIKEKEIIREPVQPEPQKQVQFEEEISEEEYELPADPRLKFRFA